MWNLFSVLCFAFVITGVLRKIYLAHTSLATVKLHGAGALGMHRSAARESEIDPR